jgi:lipopolysaccharide biosynthesis glycosyltransferase
MNILITPLYLPHIKNYLNRPIERRGNQLWCPISDAPMSTEFAISRFAVPHIQREGWALFMDSDIVCLADINELFDLADDRFAVMVVKHGQKHEDGIKMDGQMQTVYARKNWSSVMLFQCDHPANRRLTADALNTWPGRDLHAFKWLDDDLIGSLPKEWNHLVDVDPLAEMSQAKILHYTLGCPALPGWEPKPTDGPWNTARMHCPFY